jgi:hypothetical protein
MSGGFYGAGICVSIIEFASHPGNSIKNHFIDWVEGIQFYKLIVN